MPSNRMVLVRIELDEPFQTLLHVTDWDTVCKIAVSVT
jgi:hypothetical protein